MERRADAGILVVVGREHAAEAVVHVLLAVHDRAVHEPPQVRLLARRAVPFTPARRAARRHAHVVVVAHAVVGRCRGDAEQHRARSATDPARRKSKAASTREHDERDAELVVAIGKASGAPTATASPADRPPACEIAR